MPISPGARLGSYEVLSPLGAGGMGEVYKARASAWTARSGPAIIQNSTRPEIWFEPAAAELFQEVNPLKGAGTAEKAKPQ